MPGRRSHDTEGSARNHRAMGSGRKRHQLGQLGRLKRAKFRPGHKRKKNRNRERSES